MDGDEVVVEIVHEKRLPASTDAQQTGDEYTPQAQVLGVLKRRVNVTERLVVCTVNPNNTGGWMWFYDLCYRPYLYFVVK